MLTRRSANSLGGGQQRRAAVAANFNGDFAVAWESDHTGTAACGRARSAAGRPAGSAEVEISTGTGAGAPSVGIDDQAGTVVGWTVAGADPAVLGPRAQRGRHVRRPAGGAVAQPGDDRPAGAAGGRAAHRSA